MGREGIRIEKLNDFKPAFDEAIRQGHHFGKTCPRVEATVCIRGGWLWVIVLVPRPLRKSISEPPNGMIRVFQ
jgi:hypothetical protein